MGKEGEMLFLRYVFGRYKGYFLECINISDFVYFSGWVRKDFRCILGILIFWSGRILIIIVIFIVLIKFYDLIEILRGFFI